MKRHFLVYLSILLTLALVSALAPERAAAQQSDDLIKNGDFETGTSYWEGLSTAQLTGGGAPSGQNAVKISAGEVTQGLIPVTPGVNYVLTAWFKWTTFQGSDWGYDRIAVFDPDFVEIASLKNLHALYPQGNWQKVALTFTASSAAVRINFGMFGPQNQVELYFDQFQLFQRTQNLPPQLTSVQAGQTAGQAPFTTSFSSDASDPDGAIQHYHWDFGDGSVSTLASPQHTYVSRGDFPVKLTVWDNDGVSAQKTLYVKVEDAVSPAVQVTAPTLTERYGGASEQMRLKGAANPTGGSRIASVVWDNISTGEAGIAAVDPQAAAAGGSINWTSEMVRLKPGKNDILVSATDNQGRVGTYRMTILRNQDQPVVKDLSPLPQTVPVYEKVEFSFDLDTVASVPFYTYNPKPPAGIPASVGLNVEASISTPSGKTITQPGFYMTAVDQLTCSDGPCFQQTNQSRWMVRFSPQEVGQYQVTLNVEDASGKLSLPVGRFLATSPTKPGFIRASPTDTRYFEFSNGKLFWPGGPASGPDYSQYPGTGLNLERPWMAGIGAYSTNFARWMSNGKDLGNEGYDLQLRFESHFPGHQLSQLIEAPDASRLWMGWLNGAPYRPVLKKGSQYQVMVRFKAEGLTGPVDPAYPYGFAIKKTAWPSDNFAAENRNVPSYIPIVSQNQDWHTVVSRFTATEQDADKGRPYINLYLDNVSAGKVYIDRFSLREVLPGGALGGELIPDANADLQSYVDPDGAAYIDWQVQQGEQNGVYFKYVVHDKRDWIQNHLLANGTFAEKGDGYYQPSGTAAHWLLEQWWRYIAARWGYSTAIHSWELNNEGPPDDPAHYQLAQDFARFMHQTDSHPHLVSTSFWSGWQGNFFGNNQQYSDIGYADVHEYIQDKKEAANLAQWQLDRGAEIYQTPVGKPILRGETGIGQPGDDFYELLKQPNDGGWYHNLLWSQLGPDVVFNPNYWWSDHIKQIDIASISQPFYRFVSGLDVNTGGYTSLDAGSNNAHLTVIGQKNQITGKAFLWIQNQGYTWTTTLKDGGSSPPAAQSGTITIMLKPQSATYRVEWWDTNTGLVNSVDTISSNNAGIISLEIYGLASDAAVKIEPK